MKGNQSVLKSPIAAAYLTIYERLDEDVQTSMENLDMKDNREDGGAPKSHAIPGTKRVDGTYTPAVVPPEWEA
jgi:hypothetical protein